MNVWDWVELGWLVGLSVFAVGVIAVQNRTADMGDRACNRVRVLERENKQLRRRLREWTDDR